MVAPFFGDFVHREVPDERIELEWREVDDPDTPRGPRQLSDGTLRFICLATLLLQPSRLQPDTILVDEPELSLHPYALVVLASLLQQDSEKSRSSSPRNRSSCEPDVAGGRDRHRACRGLHPPSNRLDAERLKEWLEEYSLGELWKMNVGGGRPTG